MLEIDGFQFDPEKIPYHVAIIMDGNGRWASKHKFEKVKGHYEGLETVIRILKACKELKIRVLTLYAFSTENWKRSRQEIDGLMGLFEFFFKREFENLKREKVRILHSGLLNAFSPKIVSIIEKMTKDTEHFTDFTLNLGINYSGRCEITEAVKNIASKITSNQLNIQDISQETISQNLFHPEIPDPDLLIRTSGELRISNFLLWQIAYSELWFTDILWPDFQKKDFLQAIYDYQHRERRFGGRNE